MKLLPIILFLLFSLMGSSAASVGLESAEHFDRGVNVWRALTLPKRIDADEDRYDSFPYGRSPPSVSSADYQRIRQQGFDFIRLPLDPTPFFSDDVNWSDLLGQVRGAVKDALNSNLSVIVDIHPPTSHKRWNIDRLIDSLQSPGDPILAKKYTRLIHVLTELMVAEDSTRLAIEPMNEPDIRCLPNGDKKVQIAFATARNVVRKVTDSLRIVYDSACKDSWKTLVEVADKDIISDPNILFSFHFYEPFIFTHQGSTWSKSSYLSNVKRFPYSVTTSTVKEAVQKSIDTVNPASSDFQVKRKQIEREILAQVGGVETPTLINDAFSQVDAWAQRNSISTNRILLGEFGTLRSTPKSGPSEEDRAKWLLDVRTAAERRGFSWAVWEYIDAMGITNSSVDRALIPSVQNALGLTRHEANSDK